MGIGKMKYLIALQCQSLVPDGRGGLMPTPGSNGWQTVDRVFADIELPHRLTALVWQGQVSSEIIHKFSIWRREDVRIGWQVLWDNRIFSVAHTYLFNQRVMVLVVREVER
jgi:head-tail adaptor